ncbi:MAG: hypothetical protein ABW123_26835 [Cystobacter sp.]
MKNAMRAVGLSLTMGLMVVGCGAPLEETEQESALEVREDAIPDCSVGGAYTAYYSDATQSVLVGERGCYCNSWVSWGKTTAFRMTAYDYCG